jgi:hypothetical protein
LGIEVDETLVRDRARRLFLFLKELAQLRSRPKLSYSEYPSVIWFDDLPLSEEHILANSSTLPLAPSPGETEERAEGTPTPKSNPESKTDSDRWLTVLQPHLPPPPSVPAFLRQWVSDKELKNSSQDAPRLKDELKDENGENKSGEFSPENDEPVRTEEINVAWTKYLTEYWHPWAIQDRKLKPIQKLYESLYNIYQMQQRSGEQYELVLGAGLLGWRPQGSEPIKRHILTTRASLAFDAARGAIQIGPPPESAEIVLEQDMIDVTDRPKGKDREALAKLIGSLDGDLWQTEKVADILKSWVHAVSPRGHFEEKRTRVDSVGADPVIQIAPALILRERTEQSLIQVFEKISEQLEHVETVPLGIKRLVTIADDESGSPVHSDFDAKDEFDNEVYFPLLSNPAQRDIANRLKSRQGVLVQGPPGTGKSQTIANLVCHLLAQGKRVLVTSHTPRALSVLRDKFPDDLKALCVTVIGEDSNEILKSLEDSVRGITAKHHSFDLVASQESQVILEQQLSDLRKRENALLTSLSDLRQSDTYVHQEKFGTYTGTAQAIAFKLNLERDQHGWFLDTAPIDTESPLTNEQAMRLLKLIRGISKKEEEEVSFFLVDQATMPVAEKFAEMSELEEVLKRQYEPYRTFGFDAQYESLVALNENDRQEFGQAVVDLNKWFEQIARRPEPWLRAAVKDVALNRDKPWRELFAITWSHLQVLDEKARQVTEMNVSGLDGKDIYRVKADATELRDHFAEGGKLGFGPFRPKVAKESLYLTKDVFLNGKRCETVENLDRLLVWLDVEERLSILSKHWNGIGENFNGSALSRVATFRTLADELQSVILVHEQVLRIQKKYSELGVRQFPNWADAAETQLFRSKLGAASILAHLRFVEGGFTQLQTTLQPPAHDPGAHPVHQQLLGAVLERDAVLFQEAVVYFNSLHQRRKMISAREDLLAHLRKFAPNSAAAFREHFDEPAWDERFGRFEATWNWSRAQTWLKQISKPNAERELIFQLEDCSQWIRLVLGELAVLKSWMRCFERLSEKERQYLIAWTKAVKRIGKGTGKYAGRHRQSARENMQHCKSAIPAWIMPIHKVAETIEPGQDSFDVVIVDEASQSGPEALFLQYLAKRIVVVGDDKQISPDFIGFNRENVDSLRERYLFDIPHADSLGLDNSFFDQAEIRYGGRIRLREHFRCMPEIIQFSNGLCYASEPLIPLRQFGADRLIPLLSTYIDDGFMTQDAKQINAPEADALVQTLKECIKDPSYADKTFGVISLMNTSQQAKYIEEKLKAELTPDEITMRKIRVGDPYDFQGDERDVIFLSMVSATSEGKRIGALTKEKDERRFNVAASRARDQMWLFHSVNQNELSPKCLRAKLLDYFQLPQLDSTTEDGIDLSDLQLQIAIHKTGMTESEPPQPFENWLEAEVYSLLKERGFTVIPKLTLNEYKIDLVIEGRSVRMAVECESDEWEGSEQYLADLDRQRELERCGMRFCRVRGSAYYLDPERALQSLCSALEEVGIKPKVARAVPRDAFVQQPISVDLPKAI